jgi:hypothetical protein
MPLYYLTPNMTVYMHEYVQQGNFIESRRQEINGLLERGVFSIVLRSGAERHRLYGGGFVDQMKNEGLPTAFEKYRFVIQMSDLMKQSATIPGKLI